jgi:hypothetical protein
MTDGQRYFEYTTGSEAQSWTVKFTFEKEILIAVQYEVTPCTF